MTYKCVYCDHQQTKPFKREHVIPRGLGMFLNDNHEELTIKDRVCGACNNELCECDGELCYAGPEAMLRRVAGIKGRKRKVKHNPFYSNPYSREPARLVGKFPDNDYPSLFEVDPATGGMNDCNQMIFVNPKTGKWEFIRLEKGMKKKDLVDEIMRVAGRTDLEFYVSHDDQQPWIKELLGNDYDRIVTIRPREDGYNKKIPVKGIFTITEKHHRAVAKIAFNYMMYFKPLGISGREEVFRPIRDFIRYGKGHPNDFVRFTGKHVLHNADIGWRPKDMGHIVTCEINKQVFCWVHLFTGGEYGHGAYRVRVGESPYHIIKCRETIGNWFRITSQPKDSKDAGEVKSIHCIRNVKQIPGTRNLIKAILGRKDSC